MDVLQACEFRCLQRHQIPQKQRYKQVGPPAMSTENQSSARVIWTINHGAIFPTQFQGLFLTHVLKFSKWDRCLAMLDSGTQRIASSTSFSLTLSRLCSLQVNSILSCRNRTSSYLSSSQLGMFHFLSANRDLFTLLYCFIFGSSHMSEIQPGR